jgi:hypothetical protein
MNFFEVLLNPEREESELRDRALVCTAANILQVGEFQLLQLAYHGWFGRDLPEARIAPLFTAYMLRNEVPHWARHYARTLILRDQRGELDSDDPRYHRFDHAYHSALPEGARAFCAAAGVVALTLVAAILAASVISMAPTSILPPYFERDDVPRDAGGAANAGGR